MRRVTDVLDCWFESGSMPFAQVHYPFERAEWFESHFPADFIVEYVGQTRGWFYTMHVLATALFDRPPFRHCVAHGIVLGRRRAQDVQAPGELPRARHGVRHVGGRRHALVPAVVAHPAGPGPRGPRQGDRGGAPPGPEPDLERLVLPVAVRQRGRHPGRGPHRRHRRARPLHPGQDRRPRRRRHGLAWTAYDLFGACASITRFLDALNNWYIRRSRDRFWRRPGRLDRGRGRQGRRLRHLVHRPHHAVHDRGPAAAPADRSPSTGASPASAASTWPTGPPPVPCPPTPRWSRPWTSCATCARPRTPCARPRAGGPGCRCAGSPWPPTNPERLAPLRRPHRRRGERQRGRARPTRWATSPTRSSPSCTPPSVPASGPTRPRVIAAVRAGRLAARRRRRRGRRHRLEPGEYELVLRPRNAEEGRTLPDDVGVVTLDTAVDDDLEAEGSGPRRGPPGPGAAARRRSARLGLHQPGDRHHGRHGQRPSRRTAPTWRRRPWPWTSPSPWAPRPSIGVTKSCPVPTSHPDVRAGRAPPWAAVPGRRPQLGGEHRRAVERGRLRAALSEGR